MRYLLLFLFSIVTVCCGVDPDVRDKVGALTPHNRTIDPELKLYYNEFVALCKEYKNKKCLELRKNIREIVFKPKIEIEERADKNTIAICIIYETGPYMGQRSIWVSDEEVYPRLKVVMYHELGHCLLNKDHESQRNLIMSEESSTWPLFTWEAQLKYLFTGVK